MTDATPGSARRRRAVFGRWPKTRECERRDFQGKSSECHVSQRAVRRAAEQYTRAACAPQKLREHAFG